MATNNLLYTDPSLSDLLNLKAKEILLNTNCHHIGTIESFSSLTQTATVSINYTKTFQTVDSIGNTNFNNVNYAQISDCPVICLGGGTGYLTFPIESGDECLLLFNDRDIDNWFSTGASNSPPASGRLHAFADAVCLVGLRSTPNVILGYDTDAVTLAYEGKKISIYSDKVKVDLGLGVSLILNTDGTLEINNPTGEFVSALSQLFSDIQSATTNTMFGPQPLIMPTFVADLAIFNSFKS